MIEHRHGIREKAAALTFDDGPSRWTGPILDLLTAHGGTATFFVLGSAVAGREAMLERIVTTGSELANHTYDHLPLTELTDTRILEQIARTSALIEDVAGVTPRYWRAPYFACDERVRSVIAPTGLEEVGSSVITEDYVWSARETAECVLSEIRPGSIVDLHDGCSPPRPSSRSRPTREETVRAVAEILKAFDERGFRSVTVSELVSLR